VNLPSYIQVICIACNDRQINDARRTPLNVGAELNITQTIITYASRKIFSNNCLISATCESAQTSRRIHLTCGEQSHKQSFLQLTLFLGHVYCRNDWTEWVRTLKTDQKCPTCRASISPSEVHSYTPLRVPSTPRIQQAVPRASSAITPDPLAGGPRGLHNRSRSNRIQVCFLEFLNYLLLPHLG
jgi:hypothetical protein